MIRDRLTPMTIPSRRGRIAIVTGASSGIGEATARALALAGAEVVLAVRNLEKGSAVLERLNRENPEGSYRVAELDLASLDSVRDFVGRWGTSRVDILVNNAGGPAPRQRQTNADGNELTLATNYLGHFALTGLLLDNLRSASRGRVVCVSSFTASAARLDFQNLQLERGYRPLRAYANSKLAAVMFARELQRRSSSADWGINAHAAHPGWAGTPLVARGRGSGLGVKLAGGVGMMQSANDGAQPVVFCAASRQAVAGGYYGPITRFGATGPVGRAPLPKQARDVYDLNALWQASQELTGHPFGRG